MWSRQNQRNSSSWSGDFGARNLPGRPQPGRAQGRDEVSTAPENPRPRARRFLSAATEMSKSKGERGMGRRGPRAAARLGRLSLDFCPGGPRPVAARRGNDRTGGSMTEDPAGEAHRGVPARPPEVVDESEEHRGHGGWREGGGTHFRVVMRAASLDGLSRIERSRAVHRALAEELRGGVHALALDLGRRARADQGLLGAGPRRGLGRSGVGRAASASRRPGSRRTDGSRRRSVACSRSTTGPLGAPASGAAAGGGSAAVVRLGADGGEPRAERLARAAEDQHGLLGGDGAAEPAARRLGRQVLGADVFPALAGHLVDRVGQRQREELLGAAARP